NAGERANAVAALEQYRRDFDLSETQVAYIAEYDALDPSSRLTTRERAGCAGQQFQVHARAESARALSPAQGKSTDHARARRYGARRAVEPAKPATSDHRCRASAGRVDSPRHQSRGRFFPTYAPLALGLIVDRDRQHRFPPQILTRSIVLEMRKSA